MSARGIRDDYVLVNVWMVRIYPRLAHLRGKMLEIYGTPCMTRWILVCCVFDTQYISDFMRNETETQVQ